MAEANLIPGATQVFADVLEGDNGKAGSGSVKKLFDNMQKGKYDLQDIVRVLDSLESKLKKDLLTKMFDKPSVAMNDFRTALTRFWEEVNSSGGTDLLIGGLTGIADALKGATKWISENKETIDSWVKGIKIAGKLLWELVPALLAIWGLRKVFNILGLFQGVAARTLITRLLTGNMGAMWLTMLFGAGGAAELCITHSCTLLGQLPLDKRIGLQCDNGMPTATQPQDDLTDSFIKTAMRAAIELANRPINYADKFPPVVVE